MQQRPRSSCTPPSWGMRAQMLFQCTFSLLTAEGGDTDPHAAHMSQPLPGAAPPPSAPAPPPRPVLAGARSAPPADGSREQGRCSMVSQPTVGAPCTLQGNSAMGTKHASRAARNQRTFHGMMEVKPALDAIAPEAVKVSPPPVKHARCFLNTASGEMDLRARARGHRYCCPVVKGGTTRAGKTWNGHGVLGDPYKLGWPLDWR